MWYCHRLRTTYWCVHYTQEVLSYKIVYISYIVTRCKTGPPTMHKKLLCNTLCNTKKSSFLRRKVILYYKKRIPSHYFLISKVPSESFFLLKFLFLFLSLWVKNFCFSITPHWLSKISLHFTTSFFSPFHMRITRKIPTCHFQVERPEKHCQRSVKAMWKTIAKNPTKEVLLR